MDKQLKKQFMRQFRAGMRIRDDEGHRLRKVIQSTTHNARYEAWDDKRVYGSGTRYILLAYGMVKGVPYLAIEHGSDVRPENWRIARALETVIDRTVTDEAIDAWVDAETPLPETALGPISVEEETTDWPGTRNAEGNPHYRPKRSSIVVAAFKRLLGVTS